MTENSQILFIDVNLGAIGTLARLDNKDIVNANMVKPVFVPLMKNPMSIFLKPKEVKYSEIVSKDSIKTVHYPDSMSGVERTIMYIIRKNVESPIDIVDSDLLRRNEQLVEENKRLKTEIQTLNNNLKIAAAGLKGQEVLVRELKKPETINPGINQAAQYRGLQEQK